MTIMPLVLILWRDQIKFVLPNNKTFDAVGHKNKDVNMCGAVECRKEAASFLTCKANITFVIYIDSRGEERS